ncbi:MAG: rod shape-determining protein MreC [Calditrichaeota bacterium]|nr:MAG: rod shape-determining protein MreC [Calditrichota bacterium]
MRRLPPYLAFFKRPLVLLMIYVFLSTVLMNFSDDTSLRGIRWALLQVIEFMDGLKIDWRTREQLLRENDRLKEENFRLRLTQQKLREIVLENVRLRRLLRLKESSDYKYLAARVIAEGTERGIRSVLIDIGEREGVRKNMAVINAQGLVGKVIATTPGQAIVQILLDQNMFVSARLQNSREVGFISCSGNSWLDLRQIPRNIQVEPGEVVVTSGNSQIYPPGIKIGVVTTIEETEYDFFKQIRVDPAVNFDALEEVFVVVPTAKQEKTFGE